MKLKRFAKNMNKELERSAYQKNTIFQALAYTICLKEREFKYAT